MFYFSDSRAISNENQISLKYPSNSETDASELLEKIYRGYYHGDLF